MNPKRWLISLLFRLISIDQNKIPLTTKQQHGFWLTFWENPVVRLYLYRRDQYLKDEVARAIMEGKPGNAWIHTGQRLELAELAYHGKAALQARDNERKLSTTKQRKQVVQK